MLALSIHPALLELLVVGLLVALVLLVAGFVTRRNLGSAPSSLSLPIVGLYGLTWLAFVGAWRPAEEGVFLGGVVPALLGVVATVFAFGGALVTCQGMRSRDGVVSLRKGSLVYRLVHLLPPAMREGKSLCSISWIAVLVVLLGPIVVVVVSALVTAIGLIWCFVSGQNTIEIVRGLFEFRTAPRFEMTRRSPALWTALAAVMYGLVLYGLDFLRAVGAFFARCWVWFLAHGTTFGWLAAFVVAYFVAELVSTRFLDARIAQANAEADALERRYRQDYGDDAYDAYKAQERWVSRLRTWRRQPFGSPFGAAALGWQAFKQGFCPRIEMVDSFDDEAPPTEEDEPVEPPLFPAEPKEGGLALDPDGHPA